METFTELTATPYCDGSSYKPDFTETLEGDNYPIEMDETGFPIMPACLRRTSLKLVVNNPPRITIKEEAA